jgi:CDP-paratose 2-epimerase
MQRLLITGGAGFIGVNAGYYFAAKGWQVTILDNFSRKGSEYNAQEFVKAHPDQVSILKLDIRFDKEGLAQAVSTHDAVLHLAAQVAVTTSVVDPVTDFETNAVGTFNILEAIRLSPNKPAIIYASTNKVYGSLSSRPVVERDSRYVFEDAESQQYGIGEAEALDFHSPYGCSKGAADQYVIDYARIYGLKTLALRQSCIYGQRQFGIEDQGWVAWFMIAASQNRPITIYGDGKQARDILFVDDLVQLYEAAFMSIDTLSGRAYNIGGGPDNSLSLLELISYIENNFGQKISLSHTQVRAGDQPLFVADIRNIYKDLGWQPTTSIAVGLPKIWDWINKNNTLIRDVLQ